MGLTFVVAPTAGTVLYGAWTPLPIIIGAAIMATVTLFVLLHPRLRCIPTPLEGDATNSDVPTQDAGHDR